jgi:hypothetical protein
VSALAAAAAAAAVSGATPVEVIGSGDLAAAIRAELGAPSHTTQEKPGTTV